MNKFQKIAVKMAKNDKRYGCNIFKDESLKSAIRDYYSMFNKNRNEWNYRKALGFKKWNKIMGSILN